MIPGPLPRIAADAHEAYAVPRTSPCANVHQSLKLRITRGVAKGTTTLVQLVSVILSRRSGEGSQNAKNRARYELRILRPFAVYAASNDRIGLHIQKGARLDSGGGAA